MSIYQTLAEDLRRARLDLTKCSQATHRRESSYFTCLQHLDDIAKVLEGNFTLTTPDPQGHLRPKPGIKGKVQRVIRDGNVIEGPWTKGASRGAR